MNPQILEDRKNREEKLKRQGRVVTGWWDNEPIHREMTIEEKCIRDGFDPAAVALGITLLSSPKYKPHYEE